MTRDEDENGRKDSAPSDRRENETVGRDREPDSDAGTGNDDVVKADYADGENSNGGRFSPGSNPARYRKRKLLFSSPHLANGGPMADRSDALNRGSGAWPPPAKKRRRRKVKGYPWGRVKMKKRKAAVKVSGLFSARFRFGLVWVEQDRGLVFWSSEPNHL